MPYSKGVHRQLFGKGGDYVIIAKADVAETEVMMTTLVSM
jgi:hypothetical protein